MNHDVHTAIHHGIAIITLVFLIFPSHPKEEKKIFPFPLHDNFFFLSSEHCIVYVCVLFKRKIPTLYNVQVRDEWKCTQETISLVLCSPFFTQTPCHHCCRYLYKDYYCILDNVWYTARMHVLLSQAYSALLYFSTYHHHSKQL